MKNKGIHSLWKKQEIIIDSNATNCVFVSVTEGLILGDQPQTSSHAGYVGLCYFSLTK